jgi:single-strand DNA-binding protein
MQQITITGFLSKDAEMRQTQGGQSITTLNVPVKQGWGDKEQTNWFRCNVWGKRAEFASRFRKGEFVTVTGELSIGEYNNKPQYEISASDFHSVRTAPREATAGGSRDSQPSTDWGDDDDFVPPF